VATTANILVDHAHERALSVRWIISAKDDLIWFIGSVISSYALLALYVSGVLPLVPMAAAWAILIDAPHVFGTFSRTYFDRTERRNRGRLLWGSLLFFVVGPLAVLSGAGFVFFFVAALWAYYHLVKQHYGFMVLYKKKNGDLAQVDNVLDRLFLLFAFNYPFVAFIGRDPEAMARVPSALHSSVNNLAVLLLAGTILLGIAWLARQVQRAIIGQPLDVPKYLLLGAAIPMHWIVLLTPMPHKPIAIVAILTIYHNLQYHRLIWFHNQKYRSGTNSGTGVSPVVVAPAQSGDSNTHGRDAHATVYGAASFISSRLIIYIICGIIFGLIYQGPRQYFGYVSATHGGGTGQPSLPMMLGISFLWGYAFIHYYLDAKIWRVRRDPSVGKALKMD